MNKTLCLFAGYDRDGIIDDYVLDSIKQFAKISDVYYLADCKIKDSEKQRLAPHVKNCFAYRHTLKIVSPTATKNMILVHGQS